MKKLRSMEDLSALATNVNHALTLFTGGLDSTYLLERLRGSKIKVTALVIDLGDGINADFLSRIAKHYGVDLVIEDAIQTFAEHALIPAIQAQALYLGKYPVSSSLSRPIIANLAVKTAKRLNCDAILHTANQSQNSLRRLNGSIERTGFEGYYGSPYEYSAITRKQKIEALSLSGLFELKDRNTSGDSNIWCREFESGPLDNPEDFDLDESLFQWSVWQPKLQLEESNHQICITFRKGQPTKINNRPMSLVAIVNYLNMHIGAYQIGRYIGFDHLENNEKVLEIREAPAATALMSAYHHIETAVLEMSLLQHKSQNSIIWTNEAVEGRWGSNLQQAAQAFIRHTSQFISGEVTFSLSRGQLFMSKIIAENPLYLTDRDAWEINVARERSLRSLTFKTDSNLFDKSA